MSNWKGIEVGDVVVLTPIGRYSDNPIRQTVRRHGQIWSVVALDESQPFETFANIVALQDGQRAVVEIGYLEQAYAATEELDLSKE